MAGKTARPLPLAIILIAGAAVGLLFVLRGSAWAVPFIVTATFGVAALVHVLTARGPEEGDVEAVRAKLWHRYHPREAAEPAVAGVRKALETSASAEDSASRQALAEIDDLERAVANADGGSDRALAYVERVIDRQINKLRGVLSFDALIIAFLSFERQRIGTATLGPDYATGCLLLLTVVLLSLVISSVMCLDLFRVIWSEPANFDDFETEHRTTVKLVAERTVVVERAVRLSEIAVVGAVACFLLIELQTAFLPASGQEPSTAPPTAVVQKTAGSAAADASPIALPGGRGKAAPQVKPNPPPAAAPAAPGDRARPSGR